MMLWQDIRLAFRMLRRSPGLVAIAVVSLAFGIGANALVFSTGRALVLRPLPVPDAGNVFALQAGENDSHSYPNYLDFRNRAAAVADLAAYRIVEAALDTGSGARSAWGYLATGSYFEMLDIRPALGRFFTAAEDVGRSNAPLIVVSDDYWRGALAADPSIVGRDIRINGRPYTVLGVAPAGFHGTEVFFRAAFWVPMTMAPMLEPAAWLDARGAHNVYVAGRVRAGVTPDQAQQAHSTIAGQLRAEHPDVNRNLRVRMTEPGLFGDLLRRPAAAFLTVTLALALLVLLAACANLANLLAARTIDRFRELAIRLSLGGTRAAVARQLTVETFLLCITGGAAGFVLASALLRALSEWRPSRGLPFALDVTPDATVLLFGAAVSLGSAVLAVAAAARRAWKTNPGMLMRTSANTMRVGRWTCRDLLLGVQVALCSLLVTTSLVALDNLRATVDAPLGFNADDLTVASFDLSQVGYDRERGLAFRARLVEAMSGLAGIDGVTFTSALPLTTDQSSDTLVAERPLTPADARGVDSRAFIVPGGYFDVMETPLVAGREFRATDAGAVIVNRTLARRLFGDADAIGRGILTGPNGAQLRVIGVAADGSYRLPGEAPLPAVFWNAGLRYRPATTLLVRSRLPRDATVRLTRRAIADLDPTLPVTFPGSARDVMALAFLPATAAATILTALGAIAIVLAATGVYGLAAYSVSARTREIGIRVAVGARARQVLRSVLGRTTLVLVTFAGLGITLAAAASSLLASAIFQSSATDPRLLAAGAAAMIAIGLAAAWVPARRALGVDPAVTLRQG